MLQNRTVFTITFSLFVLFISVDDMQAQVTFDYDQQLVGEATDDLFGWSLDLSGDGKTIIVGALGNDGGNSANGNRGQARVYRNTFNVSFNAWSWVMLGAEINGTTVGAETGYGVSINNNGNTIAIGSPLQNKVRVYDLNVSNNWAQRGSDVTIFTSQSAQRAGHAVSLSGDGGVVAMGAPTGNKVWVYDIDPVGGLGLLSGNPLTLPGTYAGGSVELDDEGNTLVVGGYKANSEKGQVYVYDFIGTSWVQRGLSLNGLNNYDQFGFDVSISNDGNTIAVGSKGWDGNPDNSTYEIGRVVIYDWNGSSWVQRGMSIEGSNIFDQCGYSICLSGNGNRIAVGYRGNSTAFQSAGHVRIFDWDGSAWQQNGDPIYGNAISAYAGHSVGLSDNGSILAIGSSQGSGPLNQWTNHEGIVRIYEGTCLVSSTGISQNGNTLTAAAANASYQWIDCDNGNQPIANANSQSFVPSSAGNYAVQITESGCTQTSACMAVQITGLEERMVNDFSVFPNPSSDRITVSSSSFVQEIQLFDAAGKWVLSNGNSNTSDLSTLAPGVYQVRIRFEDGQLGFSKVLKY